MQRNRGKYSRINIVEENIVEKIVEWKRLQISSRKLKIPREHFMQGWAQQKWYGPNRSRRY